MRLSLILHFHTSLSPRRQEAQAANQLWDPLSAQWTRSSGQHFLRGTRTNFRGEPVQALTLGKGQGDASGKKRSEAQNKKAVESEGKGGGRPEECLLTLLFH